MYLGGYNSNAALTTSFMSTLRLNLAEKSLCMKKVISEYKGITVLLNKVLFTTCAYEAQSFSTGHPNSNVLLYFHIYSITQENWDLSLAHNIKYRVANMRKVKTTIYHNFNIIF